MIKKKLHPHQFKKINEDIIFDLLNNETIDFVNCISITRDEMVECSDDNYFNEDSLEAEFYIEKYDSILSVCFDIEFSFDVISDPGDYHQPPEYDITNENITVNITSFCMEDYDLDIDLYSEDVEQLEIFIENFIMDY
tara:strand:- start:774 stop:1187 length:414 start_codon:yes stop_codon:yes gene_type:complete